MPTVSSTCTFQLPGPLIPLAAVGIAPQDTLSSGPGAAPSSTQNHHYIGLPQLQTPPIDSSPFAAVFNSEYAPSPIQNRSTGLPPPQTSLIDSPRFGAVSGPESTLSSTQIHRTGLPALQTPYIDSPHFVQGLALPYVLEVAGISPEQQTSALYTRQSSTGLWAMVKNHQHMCEILQTLGLSPMQENNRVKFTAGLTLTTEDLIRHFNWSANTFVTKSRIFEKARLVSTWSWKGIPPPVSDQAPRKLYLGWRDIVAMFGPGGFCEQPRQPRSDNVAEETERRAATLSQNQLKGLLGKLHPYLDRPPT